jgi:hypothetical protein
MSANMRMVYARLNKEHKWVVDRLLRRGWMTEDQVLAMLNRLGGYVYEQEC